MCNLFIRSQPDLFSNHMILYEDYLLCRSEKPDVINSAISDYFSPFTMTPEDPTDPSPGVVYCAHGKHGVMLLISYGRKMTITPETSNKYVYISMTLSGDSQIVVENKILCTRPGDTVVYDLTKVRAIELSKDCQRAVFGISKRFFCDFCNLIPGVNLQISEAVLPRMINNNEVRALWPPLMAMLFRPASCRGEETGRPHPSELFEEAMLFHLMMAADVRESSHSPLPHYLPNGLSRVINHIEENITDNLTLQDIARIACCSIRSLQRAFMREFNLSPMQYFKKHRLKCAHDALSSAGPDETVTAVAFRFGFYHLGQFSKDYKIMFGRSPSQTLHGARKISSAQKNDG